VARVQMITKHVPTWQGQELLASALAPSNLLAGKQALMEISETIPVLISALAFIFRGPSGIMHAQVTAIVTRRTDQLEIVHAQVTWLATRVLQVSELILVQDIAPVCKLLLQQLEITLVVEIHLVTVLHLEWL